MQRTVEDWLSLLEKRHPTEIELGLDRIAAVAKRMGISPGHAHVITVAGTNGKGSTCAMIDALVSKHGYRTGRYASPHLLTFHERISIAGVAISDTNLLAAFSAVETARGDISLTFFEFTTLAAFWSFQQAALDLWIVEVGLGGRLDATNILDADVAVVTGIALDHQDWLGTDLIQIGREKAGIFRPQGLAVLGQITDCEGVIDVSQRLGTQLFRRATDFDVTVNGNQWHWQGRVLDSTGSQGALQFDHLPVPQLPLMNAATAIQATVLLYPEVTHEQVSQALSEVSLAGRMQSFTVGDADCLVDVGHNPQAARYIVDVLAARAWRPEALVLGMLSDKDVTKTAEILLEMRPTRVYLATLSVPRGRTAEQLAAMISTDIELVPCDSVVKAIDQARQLHKKLLICGSFYTVASAIHHFQEIE